ncbi:RDD family protein [Kaistella sp. G5-32]|uniref:RDD family protein n=1 Tax=Kaistella gelatinilytica TaxID=2787636 RepID=A0ABS0FC66_9FLAO|nr:RDD family protein [Kaistella gelatinilytica]MBF8457295.1 RDD family protein [Kaistella gelatinilytica]
MARTLQVIERNKAEKIYRFINYLVDFAFSLLIMWFLLGVFAVLKYYILGVAIEKTADELENMDPLIDRIFTLLAYAFIMFLKEFATKGRSLGKLITGTKVVKTDGSELTMLDFLKRNFIRAVPFDQLSFLGSTGWHDNLADTAVVRKRSFENAKSLESELELIGVKENL